MKEDREKRPSDLPGQKLFGWGFTVDDRVGRSFIKGAKAPDRGRRPEPPNKNASESDA